MSDQTGELVVVIVLFSIGLILLALAPPHGRSACDDRAYAVEPAKENQP